MDTKDRIDKDIFRVVTRAIAESDNLVIMAENLSQILVGTLEIKGCTIFVLNQHAKELEILTSFGMSSNYLSKGPVLCNSSISETLRGKPVVIPDVNETDQLQYPDRVLEEGIGSIVSVPITFSQKLVGVLRLYHSKKWDISKGDIESLMILAEIIGLAMTYTEIRNVLGSIKENVNRVDL